MQRRGKLFARIVVVLLVLVSARIYAVNDPPFPFPGKRTFVRGCIGCAADNGWDAIAKSLYKVGSPSIVVYLIDFKNKVYRKEYVYTATVWQEEIAEHIVRVHEVSSLKPKEIAGMKSLLSLAAQMKAYTKKVGTIGQESGRDNR